LLSNLAAAFSFVLVCYLIGIAVERPAASAFAAASTISTLPRHSAERRNARGCDDTSVHRKIMTPETRTSD